MSEQVVAPPTEEALTTIPQPELVSLPESERAIWEREAVREVLQHVEVTGDGEHDEMSSEGLYKTAVGMLYPRNTRGKRKRHEHLPEVTTVEGLEEVLSQVIQKTEEQPRLLGTKVVEYCAAMLSDAYDRLPPSVSEANPELSVRFLSALIELADSQESKDPAHRDTDHRKRIYEAISKQFLAELAFEDTNDPDGILTPQIHQLWNDPDFLEVVSRNTIESIARRYNGEKNIWSSESAESSGGFSELEIQLYYKIFASLGFSDKDQDQLRSAWGSIDTTERIGKFEPDEVHLGPEYIKKQFDAMIDLSRRRFDAPKRLLDEFGIRNYFRYTSDQLLGQLARLEEGRMSEQPEVVLTASHDWNGALDDSGTADVHKVKFGEPVFIEASTATEAARRLVYIARQGGPINRLLIEAHGNNNLLEMSDDGRAGALVNKDLVSASNGLGRLVERGIISADAEVIFFACNTGGENSIAQAIASKTGVRVVAPSHLPGDVQLNARGIAEFTVYDEATGRASKEWRPGSVHEP